MAEISSPYLIYLGNTQIPGLAKTGLGLAYWRPERCIGQLRDEGCVADLGLPDLSIAEAVSAGARTLVLGTAFIGGQIPPEWISRIVEALEAGMEVASGMHTPLRSIPAIAEAADRTGGIIHDVRLAHGNYPIATGLPRAGQRLLAIGTDCAVGKKYAALAIHREMVAQGMNATFRATGQTGVLIDGKGICVDAIVSDFIAGAVEQLTPANDAAHWDVIEGQGALIHPAYAGVSLGLLHGAQPTAFVVCHEDGREELSAFPGHKTATISEIKELAVLLSRRVAPEIKCAGICLNTSRLTETEARQRLADLSAEHGVPACDPVRFGVADIISTLE